MHPKNLRALAFIAYGLVLYSVAFLWVQEIYGPAFWISLTVVPLCLGAFAQLVFDPRKNRGYWRVSGISLGFTALLVIILLLIELEALLCVVMAAPIIVVSELIGVGLARWMLTKYPAKIGSNTLKASLVLLPLLALPLDQAIVFAQADGSLRSEIIINATPAEVWAQSLVIPTIQPDERIWTFSHNVLGTPQPISAALDGNLRSLKWTKGVRFQEIITDRVEHQLIAWRFNFHDPDSLASFDPHVSPNSEMLRVTTGSYRLEPLEGGKTRLILTSHYQTRSPFNAYLRLWGKVFLGDFHTAVLAVIKSRSETPT